ncbi:MAG: trypsin-like peptidase domain-containing protein [Rhodanobacteraceae bacterium]
MPTSRPRTILCCGVVAITLALAMVSPAGADTPPRVDGVWQTAPSKSTTATALKLARYPQTAVAVTRFAPIDASRVQRTLAKRNLPGPLQIGIARDRASESDSPAVPGLQWMTATDGGRVARMQVTSPDARALRVGIQVNAIANGTELRVFGSADPDRIIGPMTAAQIRASLVANAMYWTPHTDGETQTLEWYVPADQSTSGLHIRLTGVSHLLAAADDAFRLPQTACANGTGPDCSAPCEVDVACEQNPSAGYQAAVAAVAQMELVVGGNGYLCTGTLLNDTSSSRTPYLYSAHHCLDDQTSASTLNTFWFVENTHCGDPISLSPDFTERTNGADILYDDPSSDVLLLRLRDNPPTGSFFLGWDATQVPLGTDIVEIHHPLGDVKKISRGTVERYIDTATDPDAGVTVHNLSGVSYTSGIVEGGSSGSGLLTRRSNGNYYLRGGLFGASTDLSCDVVGQPPSSGNESGFSRFDLAFSHLAQYLAPTGASFQITAGITGSWFDPAQSGHGFSIEVLPGNVMLLYWYVFAPNGGQAWITAVGPIDGNTAVLDASMTLGSGGRFPPHFNASAVHNEPWGTITLSFTDCSNGEAGWQPIVAGYPAGSMPITRLTQPDGLSCP